MRDSSFCWSDAILLERKRCVWSGLCASTRYELNSDRHRAEGSCLDERHKLLAIKCLADMFTL